MDKRILTEEDISKIHSVIRDAQVHEKVGYSGLGTIYRIAHPVYGVCALKILEGKASKNPKFLSRFITSIAKAKTLRHDNIAQIYDVGDNDIFFVLREMIEGKNLTQHVLQEKQIEQVGFPEATRIFLEIIAGLQEALGLGLVHRNLKPNNLILSTENCIKIVDFSLPPTTPQYLSPEQCQGKRSDIRSDIYSLGAIYFFLLTGKEIFEAKRVKEIMQKHLEEPCPNILEVRPDLPSGIELLLYKMLAKNPQERFHSYEEVLANIDEIQKSLHKPPSDIEELTLEIYDDDDDDEDEMGDLFGPQVIEIEAEEKEKNILNFDDDDDDEEDDEVYQDVKVETLSKKDTEKILKKIEDKVNPEGKAEIFLEKKFISQEPLPKNIKKLLEEASNLSPYLENKERVRKRNIRFPKEFQHKVTDSLHKVFRRECWVLKDLDEADELEVEIDIEQALILHYLQEFERQIESVLGELGKHQEQKDAILAYARRNLTRPLSAKDTKFQQIVPVKESSQDQGDLKTIVDQDIEKSSLGSTHKSNAMNTFVKTGTSVVGNETVQNLELPASTDQASTASVRGDETVQNFELPPAIDQTVKDSDFDFASDQTVQNVDLSDGGIRNSDFDFASDQTVQNFDLPDGGVKDSDFDFASDQTVQNFDLPPEANSLGTANTMVDLDIPEEFEATARLSPEGVFIDAFGTGKNETTIIDEPFDLNLPSPGEESEATLIDEKITFDSRPSSDDENWDSEATLIDEDMSVSSLEGENFNLGATIPEVDISKEVGDALSSSWDTEATLVDEFSFSDPSQLHETIRNADLARVAQDFMKIRDKNTDTSWQSEATIPESEEVDEVIRLVEEENNASVPSWQSEATIQESEEVDEVIRIVEEESSSDAEATLIEESLDSSEKSTINSLEKSEVDWGSSATIVDPPSESTKLSSDTQTREKRVDREDIKNLFSSIQEQLRITVDFSNYHQSMAWLKFLQDYDLEKDKHYYLYEIFKKDHKRFRFNLEWLFDYQNYQENIAAIKAFFQGDYEINELGRGGMGLVLKLITKHDATILSLRPENQWARHYFVDYLTVRQGADGKEIIYSEVPAASTFVVKVGFKGFEDSLIMEAEILESFTLDDRPSPTIIGLMQHGRLMNPYGAADQDDSLGYYIMMEYASHGSLENLGRMFPEERLSPTVAFAMFYGLAKALVKLHKKGIIHRDIKPANILLDPHAVPKLSDFGLAITTRDFSKRLSKERKRLLRLLDDEFLQITREIEQVEKRYRELSEKKNQIILSGQNDGLPQVDKDLKRTEDQLDILREQEKKRADSVYERYRPMSAEENALKGKFAGSLFYAAPEQFKTDKVLTPKCDIYQLGAVMFTLLTGKLPVSGKSLSEIVKQVLSKEKERVIDSVKETPATKAMSDLIFDMMKPSVDERVDIEEVCHCLDQILLDYVEELTGETSYDSSDSQEDEIENFSEKIAFAQSMHLKCLKTLRTYIHQILPTKKREKIRFTCPRCNKMLHIYENMNGKKGTCPHCKHPIIVKLSIENDLDTKSLL